MAHEGAAKGPLTGLPGTGLILILLLCTAFSDKNELKGGYLNTSRRNFTDTMMVSAFSFTEVAQAARQMMPDGGALLTLSYIGACEPSQIIMSWVCKARCESSVRYLAVDLGGQNIRVNALSAGPMKTLAGAAITGARHIYRHAETAAPLGATRISTKLPVRPYLISDLSSGVTAGILSMAASTLSPPRQKTLNGTLPGNSTLTNGNYQAKKGRPKAAPFLSGARRCYSHSLRDRRRSPDRHASSTA